MKILDNKTTAYCEGCRRDTGTTVCALCLNCSKTVITDRKRAFPRSEGMPYMRKWFGRALMNSLPDLKKPHDRAPLA